MDGALLESLSREQLIELILEQGRMIGQLTQRVGDLEARLDGPRKTPDNSSLPPSIGRKASQAAPTGPRKRGRKGRPGHHRALHPSPTRRIEVRVDCCAHCGCDVSGVRQLVCESYDHVDIPPLVAEVTRVDLHGGACGKCGRPFKGEAPCGMAPGSPFGENLRALVIYLRYTQGVSFERLARLMKDVFGVSISQGGLNAMLAATGPAFAEQAGRIRSRLLSHAVLASDETGVRLGKRNAWIWVFHHADSAVFRIASRARQVAQDFLAGHRPKFWLSDRYSGQKGLAAKGHQFCLAHLIRNAQFAIDAGDQCFAPKLIDLLRRACRVGRQRDRFSDGQLSACHRKFVGKLSRLLALRPVNAEGEKLRKALAKTRGNLFLFITNRDLEATNNGSERALRPCVTFRKITNGFRSEWGANLYADVRSVIETARRRDIGSLQAIRLTLAKAQLPLKA